MSATSTIPPNMDRRKLLIEHNLRDVHPFNIFISSMTVYKSIHVLHGLGITAVLNLVSNEEDHTILDAYKKEGLCVLHVPMFDNEEFQLDTVIGEASDFIENQLKLNRKILVHCAMGLSRAPSIVMGYLMTKLDMTYDDAYRHVSGHSHQNDGFLNQLRQLGNKQ